MGSNLLMWEAIRLGKKLGADTFDMWGSLGPNYDPNDPWAGFTRFKEGYNAKFTQMLNSHDLVINSYQYKIYTLADSIRNLYLKIKKQLC
jgi:lipid II:glycine glycyltransferase (peptidoglycan interpeptide bridge formation enzyme)